MIDRVARIGQSALVTSWRQSASQKAQNDLDGLVNAALPFATQQLDQRGEFFPYGVTMDAEGATTMVSGDPRPGDSPASADVLMTMIDGLRGERDGLRAVALVADVRVDGGDAIRVELEHQE